MPYEDGTGPIGRGKITGRGFGPCGRGMGRGRCFGPLGGFAQSLSKEEERELLEKQKTAIEAKLKELK